MEFADAVEVFADGGLRLHMGAVEYVILAKARGVRINLWVGIAMLAFGLLFLAAGLLRPVNLGEAGGAEDRGEPGGRAERATPGE